MKLLPIPTLEYQGRTYSGQYEVVRGEVVIFHHLQTKRAMVDKLAPGPLARQLLFELVAREGLGVPDHPVPPAGSDTPA